MDASMADPDEPNLPIGTAREQPLRGLKRLIGNFEFTGVYVDGNDPAVIAGFYPRTNVLLIDFRSKASVFFFGQTRLPDRHGVAPFRHCEECRCIVRQDLRPVSTS